MRSVIVLISILFLVLNSRAALSREFQSQQDTSAKTSPSDPELAKARLLVEKAELDAA
jgi:hypothetical protein